MKLTELRPEWLGAPGRDGEGHVVYPMLPSKDNAHGILFLCPTCWVANGRSSRGTHSVICWDPTVSQDYKPVPGRWALVGTTFDDLTLTAGSSSVLLEADCKAHFFVRNGEIIPA